MNVKELATEMDGLVSQGAIVDAVKQYFADDATTADYGNVTTTNFTDLNITVSFPLASDIQVNTSSSNSSNASLLSVEMGLLLVHNDSEVSSLTYNLDLELNDLTSSLNLLNSSISEATVLANLTSPVSFLSMANDTLYMQFNDTNEALLLNLTSN